MSGDRRWWAHRRYLVFKPTYWCVYWPSSWACRCEFGLRPERICVGVSGPSLWFPSSCHRCWSTGVRRAPGTPWDQEHGRNRQNQWWDVTKYFYYSTVIKYKFPDVPNVFFCLNNSPKHKDKKRRETSTREGLTFFPLFFAWKFTNMIHQLSKKLLIIFLSID